MKRIVLTSLFVICHRAIDQLTVSTRSIGHGGYRVVALYVFNELYTCTEHVLPCDYIVWHHTYNTVQYRTYSIYY